MNYRQILLWGDKKEHPLDALNIKLIKNEFQLTNDELSSKHLYNDSEVKLSKKCNLDVQALTFLTETVGAENVKTDDFTRGNYSYGKYYLELIALRKGIIKNPPDAVISPRNDIEIDKIVTYCNDKKIPLIPVGGQTSVTGALECPQGGIALDLKTHLNKIIELNKTDYTVKVQSGMLGPDLEKQLNDQGFTCGHFPQSFEYSTIGGWVAANGAGQASTGYGKMESMVKSLKVITPVGILENINFPAHAEGWDVYTPFIGSEGTLGVITEVTVRVYKYLPENTQYASFIFKDFESATNAMREMMQAEYGLPHLFRISDPEETDFAFKSKDFDQKFSNKVLNWMGYKSGSRCLMFVTVEGDSDYTRFVKSKIKKTAKKYKGFSIGEKPTKQWLDQRYHSAYLRDPFMDLGIMTDTFETAVTWDKLLSLWKNVRIYGKQRPNIAFMSHISHVYPTGVNLYFIFLDRMKKGSEEDDYQTFFTGLVNVINQNGGALSHHHGVGRTLGPWMPKSVGQGVLNSMKATKRYYDPNNIMNPGGHILGLDFEN